MKVKELIERAGELFGETVTVEGILIVRAPEHIPYVAATEEIRDDKTRSIRIELPFTIDELSDRLLPYVGTPYWYTEPTKITGKLSRSDDGVFPLVLTEISSFTVDRPHGERVDIPLVT